MNELMLIERHCPLCGPGTPKKLKYAAHFAQEDLNEEIFSARRTPDRIHFQFVHCTSCGMIFSDPACPPEELSNLYQKSKVNYVDQEADIFCSYAPILDRALKYLKTREAFLEIGGGRGFMLEYGVRTGFKRQIEVEPSEDAHKRFTPISPQSSFICSSFSKGNLPDRVDLACFFQVLDHSADPMGFLTAVHETLLPNGIAVCVTHDTDAWTTHILGRRSPIFDIEHTYLYNRSNLPNLFKKAGLTPLEIFGVPNRYSIEYWTRLSPLPTPFKTKLLSVLSALNLNRIRMNINFGNFGIIARKHL